MDKKSVIEILKDNNLWAKKDFGQNFLVSQTILMSIIKNAGISDKDFVLEIGPGLGILTEQLAKNTRLVLAIEKDRKLAEYLRNKFKSESKKVKIVIDNVLFFDERSIDGKYKIVANLPYNITSVFLRKFIMSSHKPSEMIIMIQKEVAERITAKPGNRERGFLTVMVELFFRAQIIDIVKPDCFWPVPKVESAIVKLILNHSRTHRRTLKITRNNINAEKFLKFVKIGFSQKRRQIHHPLHSGLYMGKNKIYEILKKVGIDPSLRAEDLSLDDWIRLYESFI
jgi:16S rRNA (adenine1518-N6/adenine1519-N6)-dimethyltransferase